MSNKKKRNAHKKPPAHKLRKVAKKLERLFPKQPEEEVIIMKDYYSKCSKCPFDNRTTRCIFCKEPR